MSKLQGIKHFVYPVKDLDKAKTLYSKLLGVDPYVDGEYYVGYRIQGQEIWLDPNGHQHGMTGPMGYYLVEDIRKSLQELLDAGCQIQQDVKKAGGELLIALVKDADGNIIGLKQ